VAETKILAKAMIKQIDRVIGDLVRQSAPDHVGRQAELWTAGGLTALSGQASLA
jgi:hypothetical protein